MRFLLHFLLLEFSDAFNTRFWAFFGRSIADRRNQYWRGHACSACRYGNRRVFSSSFHVYIMLAIHDVHWSFDVGSVHMDAKRDKLNHIHLTAFRKMG